jgi:hypothetical protein
MDAIDIQPSLTSDTPLQVSQLPFIQSSKLEKKNPGVTITLSRFFFINIREGKSLK